MKGVFVEQVRSTRTESLARRARLALAEQGRELLEQKRDQLLEVLRDIAGVALRGGDELAEAAAAARRAVDLAEAFDGPVQVASAAYAAHHELVLDVGAVSIMGVASPAALRSPDRAKTWPSCLRRCGSRSAKRASSAIRSSTAAS